MTVCPGSETERAQGATTREGLYSLVWSEPMLKVAARFGVSSSYMARICTVLNVPRPVVESKVDNKVRANLTTRSGSAKNFGVNDV